MKKHLALLFGFAVILGALIACSDSGNAGSVVNKTTTRYSTASQKL